MPSALGQTMMTACIAGINANGSTVGYSTTYGALGVGCGASANDSTSSNSTTVAVTWGVYCTNSNPSDLMPSAAIIFSGEFTDFDSGSIQIWTGGCSGSLDAYVQPDPSALVLATSDIGIVSGSLGPTDIYTFNQNGSVSWAYFEDEGWEGTYSAVTYTQLTTESLSNAGRGNPNVSGAGTQQYWTLIG